MTREVEGIPNFQSRVGKEPTVTNIEKSISMTKMASPTSPVSPYSPYKPHAALRRPTSPHVFARFISKTTVTINFHERFGFHEPVPWQPRTARR